MKFIQQQVFSSNLPVINYWLIFFYVSFIIEAGYRKWLLVDRNVWFTKKETKQRIYYAIRMYLAFYFGR